MTKKLKIFILSIFAFVVLTLFNTVDANSIDSISMDIFIDDYGNANVTEIWECYASQGTEVYHPYYNLGKSKITNLRVSENRNEYETLSSWKTSGNLSDKAYKCGINKISNGIELCWGISEYGRHIYTVKYDISNFVAELTDSQMIYWTLIPHNFSDSIGKAYIKIHSNFDIKDTVGVWGYGNYGGTAYVYDGYIEMQSKNSLSKNEYMTILVQFPSGTFKSNNKLNKDFNYYYNMAENGAVHYSDEDGNFYKITGIIANVLIVGVLAGVVLLIVSYLFVIQSKHLDYGIEGRKIVKNVPYYRGIPCNKDLNKIYFLANGYNMIRNKKNIVGVFALKWIKEGLISIKKDSKRKLLKKKDVVITIIEEKPKTLTSKSEKKLFDLLYRVSSIKDDGRRTVDNKRLKRWCQNYSKRLFEWFEKVYNEEQDKLVEEGLLIKENKKFLGILKYNKYVLSQELKEDAVNIAGLKRYLLDYTLIKDREAIEVNLLEEYLIFAQMVGIAKKVSKQFNELYPDLLEKSYFDSYDNIYYINMWTSSAVHSAVNTANISRARADSYSSGGDGYSSGGGGGGSFGGGSGGGGFR